MLKVAIKADRKEGRHTGTEALVPLMVKGLSRLMIGKSSDWAEMSGMLQPAGLKKTQNPLSKHRSYQVEAETLRREPLCGWVAGQRGVDSAFCSRVLSS